MIDKLAIKYLNHKAPVDSQQLKCAYNVLVSLVRNQSTKSKPYSFETFQKKFNPALFIGFYVQIFKKEVERVDTEAYVKNFINYVKRSYTSAFIITSYTAHKLALENKSLSLELFKDKNYLITVRLLRKVFIRLMESNIGTLTTTTINVPKQLSMAIEATIRSITTKVMQIASSKEFEEIISKLSLLDLKQITVFNDFNLISANTLNLLRKRLQELFGLKTDREITDTLKRAILEYLRKGDIRKAEKLLEQYQETVMKLAKEVYGINPEKLGDIVTSPFSRYIPNITSKYRGDENTFKLENIKPSQVAKIINDIVAEITTNIAEQLFLRIIYLTQLQIVALQSIYNTVYSIVSSPNLEPVERVSKLNDVRKLLIEQLNDIKGGLFRKILDATIKALDKLIDTAKENSNPEQLQKSWNSLFKLRIQSVLEDKGYFRKQNEKIKRQTKKIKNLIETLHVKFKKLLSEKGSQSKQNKLTSTIKFSQAQLPPIPPKANVQLKSCALKGKTDEQFEKLHKLYTKIYRVIIVYYRHKWKIIGAAFAALIIILILLGKFVLKKSLKDLINPKGLLRAIKELLQHSRIIVRIITGLILLGLVGLIALAGYELYRQFFDKTIKEGEIIYAIEKLAEQNKI